MEKPRWKISLAGRSKARSDAKIVNTIGECRRNRKSQAEAESGQPDNMTMFKRKMSTV